MSTLDEDAVINMEVRYKGKIVGRRVPIPADVLQAIDQPNRVLHATLETLLHHFKKETQALFDDPHGKVSS